MALLQRHRLISTSRSISFRLAEDATLAALPKAPTNYNPFRFPRRQARGGTGCWIAWPTTM